MQKSDNALKSAFHNKMKSGQQESSPSPKQTLAGHGRPGTSSASTIPRNVNYYRHLLENHGSNEHGIIWVLKLRNAVPGEIDLNKKLEPTNPNPPSFYGKYLESQEQKRSTIDLEKPRKLHQLNHLLSKRLGATASLSQVSFETGLRGYVENDKTRELEKKWTNIPKKIRKDDLPQLYPSYQDTLKIKSWSTKNINIKTHSAFEGYLNYPKYPEICEAQPKNMCETRHLYYPGQLMSTVNWELSMRDSNKEKHVADKREIHDKIHALKNKSKKVDNKKN